MDPEPGKTPDTTPPPEPRTPSLLQALLPVLFLVGALGVNVMMFEGSPHIPLLLGAAAAALMGIYLGHTWPALEQGIVSGVAMALQACLILLVVGMLIGTWIVAGIVPAMIDYGLRLISPSIFLVTSCLICAIVSLATGSSWSTAGTVGIALIGIGRGLGLPVPVVAGSIISGAYLGDKMSPLSDTTNLAPAVAGTDLFTHIRHMVYTSVPSFLVALVIYAALGLVYGGEAAPIDQVQSITNTLQQQFFIHPLLLVPPVLVILMVVLRVPALPALLGGVVLGGITALAAQGTPLARVLEVAQTGYKCTTGVAAVDTLLSRGGMESMFSTVALVMCALSFGGVMERTGMLRVIATAVLRTARGTGGLVSATLLTCIGMNIIAPDQYLSIVIPGRMYKEAFAERGLDPRNLSRCLEDAGTLSSPLVPWNTCGAYMGATLGVSPLLYLPFAFVNLLNPVVSAVYGFTGWTMTPLTAGAPDEPHGGPPNTDEGPPVGPERRAA